MSFDLSQTEEESFRTTELESVKILKEFSRKKNSKKHPKRDYVLIKLIRGIKRAFRQLRMDETPRKMIHGIIEGDDKMYNKWNEFRAKYLEHKTEYDEISETSNGPNSDGMRKRTSKDPNNFKSCNRSYQKSFFQRQIIREAWYYYINLVFAKTVPEIMVSKFELLCCSQSDPHHVGCEIKWIYLRRYLTEHLMYELEIVPWAPSEISLPFEQKLRIPKKSVMIQTDS